MLKFILLVIITFLGYYFWSTYPISHGPGEMAPEKPIITRINWEKSVLYKEVEIIPIRKISAQVRIIKKEAYYFDSRSKLSPLDLLIGWGELSDERNLDNIRFHLSKRYFNYTTIKPTIQLDKILEQISLWHIVPSSELVEEEIKKLREGNIVQLEGYIVDIESKVGIEWKSEIKKLNNSQLPNTIVFVTKINTF